MALDKKNKKVDLKTEMAKAPLKDFNEVIKTDPEETNVTLFAAAANEKEAKKEAKKPPKN